MKNLLIVDVSSSVGGIETLFWGLFGRRQDYFNISFLTYSDKCAFEDEYVELGYKVYHLKPRKDIPLGFSKQIKNFFKMHKEFDYVWVNTASTSMFQCQYFAKRYTKAKVITHSHGTKFEKSSGNIKYYLNLILEKINYKKVIGNTDFFFCCSIKAGIALFGEKYRDKLILVRNGINIDKFKFSEDARNVIRCELGISENEKVIGLLGRISSPKNPLKAISIYSSYKKMEPNSRLLVVGDGNLKEDVKNLIIKEKLQDSVLLLGYRRDVQDVLSAIDILIMPSLFEGLPLTAIEAQASGVCCYLSDTITHEVAITDLVRFVGLDENSDKWASVIASGSVVSNRICYSSLVREQNYDINDTLVFLSSLLI